MGAVMPEGVEVVIEGDGYAVVDFIDRSLAGPGLNRLLNAGAIIETLTRSGPHRKYRTSEDVIRAVGLLDEVHPPYSQQATAPITVAEGAAVGPPALEWTRDQLDTAARRAGVEPSGLPNKQAVLDAIRSLRE